MKKALLVATLSLALSAVLAAGTLTPATPQPPGQTTTLTWFDPRATDFEKDLDFGRKSFSPGDMAVIKDSFFDAETCDKAGTVVLRFQFVKQSGPEDGFFLADGGIMLPDGKLTLYLHGRFSEFEAESGALGAITGGTGAYANARGELRIDEDHRLCDKRGALITAELMLE
ncbi:MAG: hypothetical protein ABR613_12315 [Actinomycetota bacterium]